MKRGALKATCRSCGAPIEWVKTDKGKTAPIETEPSEKGNVRITEDGLAVTLGGTHLEASRGAGEELYLNHFAYCPNRHRHAQGLHKPPPKPSIDVDLHPGQITLEEFDV